MYIYQRETLEQAVRDLVADERADGLPPHRVLGRLPHEQAEHGHTDAAAGARRRPRRHGGKVRGLARREGAAGHPLGGGHGEHD